MSVVAAQPDDHMEPSSMQVERYVVSLARQPERRQAMANRLAAAGVSAGYFDAVDGRAEVNRGRLASLVDHGPWGAFAAHDKACTLSHLAVLGAFVKTNAAFALIMEDDAVIGQDLGDWLADMSWWPSGGDVVRLERWCDDRLYLVMGPPKAHLGREVHPLLSRHSGTAGYLVSRAGALKILAAPRPTAPIDHHLFNPGISQLARDLNTFQVVPALVTQAPAAPAVPTAETEDGPAATRPARPFWREVKRAWSELTQAPRLLRAVLFQRAKVSRIAFASQVNAEGGA